MCAQLQSVVNPLSVVKRVYCQGSFDELLLAGKSYRFGMTNAVISSCLWDLFVFSTTHILGDVVGHVSPRFARSLIKPRCIS